FFTDITARQGRRCFQQGPLVLALAKQRQGLLAVGLFALLAALAQVGRDLFVTSAQGGETLLHLGQRHARRHGLLLASLPVRFVLADLPLGVFETDVQALHLGVGVGGLVAGVLPGLSRILDLLLQTADLTAADLHFLVKPLAALSMLADARTQIGYLLGQ